MTGMTGRRDYAQFTCTACGAKSEMYLVDAEEIKEGLPPGWELLYDHTVCAAHFDLIASVVGRALCEVIALLRPTLESNTNMLQPCAFVHSAFLIALGREETKLHDFTEERPPRITGAGGGEV